MLLLSILVLFAGINVGNVIPYWPSVTSINTGAELDAGGEIEP